LEATQERLLKVGQLRLYQQAKMAVRAQLHLPQDRVELEPVMELLELPTLVARGAIPLTRAEAEAVGTSVVAEDQETDTPAEDLEAVLVPLILTQQQRRHRLPQRQQKVMEAS
jgi:hypothetical protein